MLQRLHRRLGTAGLAVAVIALIAALGGTALAAKGALTGKQKKEVEKIAKKYAGKPGAPGAAGTNGTNGTNGKDGATGNNGNDGTNGVAGKSVVVSNSAPGCFEGGVVVEVEGSGSKHEICNGEEGSPGARGQDAGFNYLFNASTAEADPGTGELSLNAAPEAATLLWISKIDNDQNSLEQVLKNWASSQSTKGTILVREASEPSTFAEFVITGIRQDKSNKDEGSFDKFTVSFVQGAGTLADGGPITVSYFASGAEVLPTGPIETGTWSVSGTEADGDIYVPISFSTPLPAALEGAQVHYAEDADFESFCKGNPSNPRPELGNLCVYANSAAGLPANTTLKKIVDPNTVFGGTDGAGRTGAVLIFSKPSGEAFGSGTFAVRAP